ncbi:conserved hypothetical protein [Verminephrobacter eiseniae EF01-2]|uniref:Uncharacterized protein n=1 Tax=Verminephrobacter eiseniae (strain EF01-2) TaxID=391735 RepID=A1WLK9_VEREI|nr:conserved hypothetical protein [Verminephrobacter eiseniae EF01-2]
MLSWLPAHFESPHLLRAGHSLRFTPVEVEEFRKLGLDVDGARTQDDLEQALTRWAGTLTEERPDLLDKIASALAQAKGAPLPARLTRVR